MSVNRRVKVQPCIDQTQAGRSGILVDPGLRLTLLYQGEGLTSQIDPDDALRIGRWLVCEAIDNGADTKAEAGWSLLNAYRARASNTNATTSAALDAIRTGFKKRDNG